MMKTLENKQVLSQSKIWQIITNYYLHKGPSAWKQTETPYFITSNRYIAYYYAQAIIRYIKDQINSEHYQPNEPFYILELSAGSGQFSYYCLQELQILTRQLGLTHIPFCYVLTDIVEKNIKSWQDSHAFDDYIKNHTIDFALYNMEVLTELNLINSAMQLTADKIKNPLIVIANYVFDTIACDVFQIKQGILSRANITLQAPLENFDIEKPDLSLLKKEFDYQPIDPLTYYEDPIFNSILLEYQKKLPDCTITFPIMVLRFLKFLNHLSHGKMLLLTSDLGNGTLDQLASNQLFNFNYHKSLSVTPNFHAIEMFFSSLAGESIYHDKEDNQEKFITAIYSLGTSFHDLPLLLDFLTLYQQELSPRKFAALVTELIYHYNMSEMAILAGFRIAKNEPFLLEIFHKKIIFFLQKKDNDEFKNEFSKLFNKIKKDVYLPMLSSDEKYNFAMLCQALGDYQEAITYYQQYKPTPDKAYEYYRGLATCYLEIHDKENFKIIKRKIPLAKLKYLKFKIFNLFKKINSVTKLTVRYLIYVIITSIILYFIYKDFLQ